jgi:hypothetical protein
MRIVLTWQPEDTPGPQTVYVEDVTADVHRAVEGAFERQASDPDAVLTLPNVAVTVGGRREERLFRVGRLVSYEVQP